MLIIIGIMAVGLLTGYLLRHRPMKYLGKVITVVIWLLLFFLGVAAGSDERIVRWIASLGAEALAVSVAGVLGSSAFAYLLWKYAGSQSLGKGGEK